MSLPDAGNLVRTLTALPAEEEWFEFKKDNFDPLDFGQYVSALANSAMLHGKRHAFIVFGVDDTNHAIVGTKVQLQKERIGNALLEIWLSQMLAPKINVTFETCLIEDKRVEIACIEPAYDRPVRFQNVAYIRIGQSKTKLESHPEKERALWSLTNRHTFERGLAASHVTAQQLFRVFHCELFAKIYYDGEPSRGNIVEYLTNDGLIFDNLQGGYDVTNLFALLAAKNLHDFPSVANKAPRVIVYKGRDKTHAEEDIVGKIGYAISFPMILKHVMSKVTGKEIFKHGVRTNEVFYPEIAIREFLANALIHQDLVATGSKPTIEIFSDKIVMHNLGKPFVEPERIIDAPPRSRNERLASFMQRAGHCEERGSGYTRALLAIEMSNQAPPLLQNINDAYVVTLYKTTDFGSMSKDDRIRACYQHAVIRKLRNDPMNNASLRSRLGLKDTQASQVSNIIGDTLDANLIKPLDENQGNRVAKYVPFWA